MVLRKWLIFAVCACLFLMSLFYRASSAVIAPQLMGDLHLSHEALGFLGAAFFYVFAAVQFPLGPVLDKLGPRLTMTTLNLVAAMGAIIFARAESLAGGLLGRSLLGLGMASNLMGPLKLFTTWFDPRKFATLSGLLLSVGTLGSLAATSPLALLVEQFGWRGAFYTLAVVNIILTLLLILVVRDTPSSKENSGPPVNALTPVPGLRALKILFTNWNYWAISITAFIRYGAYVSIQALWAGPFLIEYLHLPSVKAGNLLLMLSIGYIFGSPFGGLLADRILQSPKKTVILGSLVATILTIWLSQWESSTRLIVLALIFLGLGFFTSFGQVVYAHIKNLMPEDMSASAMTAVNFFTMMGGGVFMHAVGKVMEHVGAQGTSAGHGYEISFLICASAFFFSTLLYFTTKDSRP